MCFAHRRASPSPSGNGARNIVPLESADEVITRAKQFDKGEVRLAGERKMLMVPGFDLGNSPSEFTREAVEGKTVLLTTTNGTAAMVGLQTRARCRRRRLRESRGGVGAHAHGRRARARTSR